MSSKIRIHKGKHVKNNIIRNLLIILGFVIIILIVRRRRPDQIEAFDQKTPTIKGIEEIYDKFYVDFYDMLVFNDYKNEYEIGKIMKITKPSKNISIVDIGSGTGHHANKLTKLGFNVTGIDISPAMVAQAKTLYPTINFKVANGLDPTLFALASIDQITCFYCTIYYIADKPLLFRNCFNWLKPGGYLSIHLVNRDTFDPILPAGNPFSVVSVQKYAAKRITSTTVKFSEYEYKSNFVLKPSVNNILEPNALMEESFKNLKTGIVRRQEHQLYMSTQSEILDVALSSGFIIHAKLDLTDCKYDNQYIFILQKPY